MSTSQNNESERELCQCQHCGRMHRKLGDNLPPAISGKLSHEDACRLSRVFNEACDPWTDQDKRINEWLKQQIADAGAVPMSATPRTKPLLTPIERRYLIFLHDIRRPSSVTRPSQRKLDDMVRRDLIRVSRRSKLTGACDYAITPVGKLMLAINPA